ncbi:MAG: MFS transporter [Candidatus Brocadiia bacterium]|nr:MFS transporter [Candidatus Brocadiia bacterium]
MRSPRTSGWTYVFRSLANRDYRFLWFSMLFWVAAGHMQTVARSYLAYELTGSAKVLAVIVATQIVPVLGLALIGGALADRMDRRKLMQICLLTSMAATLFVAVSISTGTVTWYHLLAAAAVHGAVWAFMSPTRQGLIAERVGREGLGNAIALTGAGLSTVALLAPALGGLLYAVIGPGGVSYLSAALALVGVALVGFIRRPAAGRPPQKSNVMAEIWSGLSYVRDNSLVLVLLVVVFVTMILLHPFVFLLPVLVTKVFLRESGAYGLLLSMLGLGSLLGSLAAAWLGKWRRGMLLMGGNVAAGAALLVIAFVPRYSVALVITAIVGLSEAGRRALSQALIMEQVDDEYHGRVISLYTMTFGLMPLGILPAGFAVDTFGIERTIGVLGATMFAVSILVILTQKRLRELQ